MDFTDIGLAMTMANIRDTKKTMYYQENTMKNGKVISIKQYLTELPEYNDKSICIKCGFSLIDDTFEGKDTWKIIKFPISTQYLKGYDSIIRKCLRCKYTWETKTID